LAKFVCTPDRERPHQEINNPSSSGWTEGLKLLSFSAAGTTATHAFFLSFLLLFQFVFFFQLSLKFSDNLGLRLLLKKNRTAAVKTGREGEGGSGFKGFSRTYLP
jgi:hypothetical protein